MRPGTHSFLRYPLSTLLGTEASVRVLREFALHGGELTTSAIARRTGITNQSVRNVLSGLREGHLLRVYGQGRAASYQLDPEHPTARMITELFRAEDQRLRTIQQQIGSVAEEVSPPPLAVWMFGSAARGEDRPGSDLDLLLVMDDDATVEHAAGVFRELLAGVETAQRITISVVPVSSADVLRLAHTDDPFWKELLRDAVPLYGRAPEPLLAWLRRRERRGAEKEGARG